MKQGAFTFVLHSHLPYCRNAGRWPHGEEWLHEAASETYLPLLLSLYRLKEEGISYKLTIGLTPVLVEQLADPLVRQHLKEFFEDKVRRAHNDIARFEKAKEPQRAALARFYEKRYQKLYQSFQEKFGGDLVGAFRQLQDWGLIEIVTSAATHGYLPLFQRDSTLYGQLQMGVLSYRHHFRRSPRAVWLPECAYRPAFMTEGGVSYVKPGLESFLAEMKLGCFFCETHTIEGGEPVGKAKGEVVGPYGNIPKRYVMPLMGYQEPTLKTTFLPYWVGGTEVAVLGRDNRTSMQVWSADWGYPGDFNYREFHKRDGVSGLNYWKITGARLDLAYKDFYNPKRAEVRCKEHGVHFARLVEELLADFHQRTGKYGIISSAYDTELFGHWWFEGVDWIEEVIRHLAQSEVVELTTASDFIQAHSPEDVLALPESSWGQGGNHFTWMNADTEWMWPPIHAAEARMEELVRRYPQASGTLEQVLKQAARELLLLESSDWPFLVSTGQAKDYAILRFQEHLERFQLLADIAHNGSMGSDAERLWREFYERDNVFPEIDYRLFKNRDGKGFGS